MGLQCIHPSVDEYGLDCRIVPGTVPGGDPLPSNQLTPQPFETPLLAGDVIFLHRPFDSTANFPYRTHLGTKRRMEIRFQIRFKSLPADNQVWFGMEMEEGELVLGWTSAMLVKFVLGGASIINAMNGLDMHYSLGRDGPDRGECPHLAWPLIAADTVIASPADGPLPDLAGELPLTPDAEKRAIVFDTERIFTVVYYTGYVDLAQWTACGVAGVGDFELSSLIGGSKLHFMCYCVKPLEEGDEDVAHHAGRKDYFFRYALQNPRSDERGTAEPTDALLDQKREELEASGMFSVTDDGKGGTAFGLTPDRASS